MANSQAPPQPSSPPSVLTELNLPAVLKEAINTALERGRMLSVAYVSPDGRPEISFRGSLQVYSDTQLAIWVRNPDSGILQAVRAAHVHLAVLYGEITPHSRAFVTLRGRGRIENTPEVRRTVYARSPALERDLDKQQKGVPLIIDLDSVDGIFAGTVLKMRRQSPSEQLQREGRNER